MSRRDRTGGPQPIAAALDGVLRRLGLTEVVERHDLFRDWDERVGRDIARVARPWRVDGDALIVRVSSPAWINELSLRQTELLTRLNADRKSGTVRRLIFRLDPEPKG